MCDLQKKYDKMIEIHKAIPLDGSISVLTGSNGTGKSLIRSQLGHRTKNMGNKNVVHASMELRTGTHSNLGGLGVFMRDTEQKSTSENTIACIKQAVKSIYDNYLCLDEIEIGCSLEMTMGIVQWLNENLKSAVEGTLGCLIITHSAFVVQNLDFDHWFNLDGYDAPEEWCNRTVSPINIDEYKEEQRKFYEFILSNKK